MRSRARSVMPTTPAHDHRGEQAQAAAEGDGGRAGGEGRSRRRESSARPATAGPPRRQRQRRQARRARAHLPCRCCPSRKPRSRPPADAIAASSRHCHAQAVDRPAGGMAAHGGPGPAVAGGAAAAGRADERARGPTPRAMPASEPATDGCGCHAPVDARASVPLAPLQLVDYVEPALPDRVRRRLRGRRRGGGRLHRRSRRFGRRRVGALFERQGARPIALDAVRQWRYRPIAAAQAHAVQLVFRLRE